MSEPTAGPWHAIIAASEQPSLMYAGIVTTLHFSPDPDGYVAVVADAPLGMGEQSLLEECQANAYLIAAAPALKAALLAALDQTEDGLHSDNCAEPGCWVNAAKQALIAATSPTEAAAEGERR